MLKFKTFFFTCRDGKEGSIEATSIFSATGLLQEGRGLDVIKIEEMKEITA